MCEEESPWLRQLRQLAETIDGKTHRCFVADKLTSRAFVGGFTVPHGSAYEGPL